jgi:hypothetical protein
LSERLGDVQLAGTLAGPESAWPLSEAALATALQQAGMPPGSLRLLREGGWLTIEPTAAVWPETAFHGDPGAALGESVRKLSRGARLPDDWGSTLRMVHFRDGEKIETLVGSAEDGVHAVARSVPWRPVPKPSALGIAKRYWMLVVLLAIAFGGLLWLRREAIAEALFGPTPNAQSTEQEAELSSEV